MEVTVGREAFQSVAVGLPWTVLVESLGPMLVNHRTPTLRPRVHGATYRIGPGLSNLRRCMMSDSIAGSGRRHDAVD